MIGGKFKLCTRDTSNTDTNQVSAAAVPRIVSLDRKQDVQMCNG